MRSFSSAYIRKYTVTHIFVSTQTMMNLILKILMIQYLVRNFTLCINYTLLRLSHIHELVVQIDTECVCDNLSSV